MRAVAIIALLVACGGHHHGPAEHADDTRHLYVEVAAGGSHGRALREGAMTALAKMQFIVPSDRGGDLELELGVAKLDSVGRETTCRVKILAYRLPQHDLLGIADGSARAGGTNRDAADECVRQLAGTLVAGRIRTLLAQHLNTKR
jgi:hypothetical protein